MGKCNHIVNKKVCGKPDIGDTGKCAKHGGKVEKHDYSVDVMFCPNEGTTPRDDFFSLAQNKLYKQNIEYIKGMDSGFTGGSFVNIKGVRVTHNTRGTGVTTNTIFYVWRGHSVIVYGLGSHDKSNSKYNVEMWFDGSRNIPVNV